MLTTHAPAIWIAILIPALQTCVLYTAFFNRPLTVSLQFPAGHGTIFERPLHAQLASILVKLGSTVRGKFELLFALPGYFSAPSKHFLPNERPEFFAPIPGGGMEQSSIRRNFRNTAPITTELGAVGKF
jgi:hypothetical protein